MCNEKQSMKRRYGLGTGKECRVHVQKLNSLRGIIDAEKDNFSSLSDDEDDKVVAKSTGKTCAAQSKWSDFVSKEEAKHEDEPDSKMYLNDVEVVLETPKKGSKRKFEKNSYHDNSCNKFKKQTWKQNDIRDKGKNKNEEPVEENMEPASVADIKPKPKIKFVPPTLTTSIQMSAPQASKWDDFTVGHVDNDPGVMYLDSQYQHTSLGDLARTETKLPSNNHLDSKVAKSNSKWSQFVNDEKAGKEFNELGISNGIATIQETLGKEKLQNIFSLCDDNELEDVFNV